MKFRLLDVVRYGLKVNFRDALSLFPQVLTKRKFLIFRPDHRGKIKLRNFTSDLVAFKQVFLWEEYSFAIKGEVNVIIDGGANIGAASRWFKHRFPQARIFAVEPEINNFNLLKENTSQLKDVVCLNSGLWSQSCYLKVRNMTNDNWTFQVVETEDPANAIKAISIGDIVEEYQLDRIDILKLDVETAEKKIFEKDFEKWIPRTRYMFVETHDFISKGCSKAVFSTMLKYNFSLHVLGENVIFINDDLNERPCVG